jgi:hypothetical protein
MPSGAMDKVFDVAKRNETSVNNIIHSQAVPDITHQNQTAKRIGPADILPTATSL